MTPSAPASTRRHNAAATRACAERLSSRQTPAACALIRARHTPPRVGAAVYAEFCRRPRQPTRVMFIARLPPPFFAPSRWIHPHGASEQVEHPDAQPPSVSCADTCPVPIYSAAERGAALRTARVAKHVECCRRGERTRSLLRCAAKKASHTSAAKPATRQQRQPVRGAAAAGTRYVYACCRTPTCCRATNERETITPRCRCPMHTQAENLTKAGRGQALQASQRVQ